MVKRALIIVDVQYDFLPPSGSLAVPQGEEILPVIADLLDDQRHAFELVIASRDAHPTGHISFASSHPPHTAFEQLQVTNSKGDTWSQTLWPEHCIRNTHGYELHPDVVQGLEKRQKSGQRTVIVEKGTDHQVEAYSAFDGHAQGTRELLADTLRAAEIEQVVIVGLATDYCVRATALSALKEGFPTVLLTAGARAVGGQEAAQKIYDELKVNGAAIISR